MPAATANLRKLGDYVRTHRKGMRLSQEKLAQKLGVSGKLISIVETAKEPNLSAGTLSLLDGWLDWEPGSARELVERGTPPTPRGSNRDEVLEAVDSLPISDDFKADILEAMRIVDARRRQAGGGRGSAGTA